MVAVALPSSRVVDAGRAVAQHAPPALAGHPAAELLDLDGSARGLAPAVGLLVASAVSLGLWGLLIAIVLA